jgi:trehalose-phosphatase
MKSLWLDWPKLKRKVRSSKKKLLLLDFDGTLVPIAQHPQDVVLDQRTAKALNDLGRSRFFRIAIISGRSVKDLKKYFSLKNLIFIGNHGFEMKGNDFSKFTELKKAKKIQRSIEFLVQKLKEKFRNIPGVWLEDKKYTLSLHFRNLSKTYLNLFQETLNNFKKMSSGLPVVWRRGKKVWEIRPKVSWGKGEAALYLSKRFPKTLPIVIGDDETDEDIFRAVGRHSLTIRVGFTKKSRADYYLRSTREVAKFLEEICH